jgi:hypothetical protein
MTGAMETGGTGAMETVGTGTWGVAAEAAAGAVVLFHRLLLILVTENMIIFTDE